MRAKFDAAQARYLEADQKLETLLSRLSLKYGPGMQDAWLTPGERKERRKYIYARDRASYRVFRLLDASPRDWRRGVPSHWVCTVLSYDDAFRPLNEPLTVTPPKAYGA